MGAVKIIMGVLLMSRMKSSGVQWIGEIPAGWQIGRVKNIFKTKKEVVGDKADEYERLSLTLNGVLKRSKETNDGLQPEEFKGYQVLYENELVFKLIDLENIKTSRVGLSPFTGIVSPAYITLNNEQHTKYGYYFFLSMWQRNIFNALTGDGVRGNLSAKDLLNLEYPLVPLEEQKIITEYLDEKVAYIDNIIEKTKESIEEYKKLKQSVITETVTKGLNPDVKMKNSGIEWIGEIPEHWESKKLKNVLKSPLKYGANESGIEFQEDLPRYIRITDIVISDNSLKMGNMLSLTEKQAKNFILKHNDILFARSGATVGKSFLFDEIYGLSAFAGYLIKAEISEVVNPKLIYYYTLTSAYEEWKNRIFIQSTIQNIGANKYNNMEIVFPISRYEQDKLVKFIESIIDKFSKIFKEKETLIYELESYKKSLVYELVTGKKEAKL